MIDKFRIADTNNISVFIDKLNKLVEENNRNSNLSGGKGVMILSSAGGKSIALANDTVESRGGKSTGITEDIVLGGMVEYSEETHKLTQKKYTLHYVSGSLNSYTVEDIEIALAEGC